MKELPDLPPELSQIAVLIRGKVAITAHNCIVTRYTLPRHFCPDKSTKVAETLRHRQPPIGCANLFAFQRPRPLVCTNTARLYA
jgi:hypothetical protein